MKRLSGYAFSTLFFLLPAITFWSCRQDNTLTPVAVYDRSGVHALMAPLRNAPQTFTVTAGVYSGIEGAQGTSICFYPSSFRNVDGSIVTSGTVQISLQEIYRPGDMIANRASTVMANGSPLISGGQIFISATQNGQTLYANRYCIGFRQPAASSQPMNIFVGSRRNADSVVVWGEQIGNPIGRTSADSQRNSIYYQFDSVTNFNWINCDHFYSNPGPKTNVTVALPDTSFNPSNTNLWIVFPTINSVTYLTDYTASRATYKLSTGYLIPIGIKFHIVAMSKKGGTWYYAEQRNITAVDNHQLSVVPAQKTLAEVKSMLSSL